MNITILIIVAVAIVSFFLGYYLGQGNILRHLGKSQENKPQKNRVISSRED